MMMVKNASLFFIFLKYFFQYNFQLLFCAVSAVIEGLTDLVEAFGELMDPTPYAPVAETPSLDIPSYFF